MDIILTKSFIPEIFLSLSILFQIIFNVRLVNSDTFNFPLVVEETASQTFFIILCLILLYLNIKIEGAFCNFLFVSEKSSFFIKILISVFFLFSLNFVIKAFVIQKLNFFEYFSFLLLSFLSFLLLINVYDFLTFYLIIEMQTLCFYVLATFKRNSAFSSEAGLKYFISGSFVSGFSLFGISLLYGSLGCVNFHDMNLLLNFSINTFDSGFSLKYIIYISLTFILVSVLFKVGCVPFHFWIPDTYEGSPLASTIFFSILPKLSIYIFFIRFISSLNFFFYNFQNILICFGLFSIVLGTFLSLSQKRIKRLIIFSSIAQVGFLIIGLCLNSIAGISSFFYYLFVYLVTSVLIWGKLVCFYEFHSTISFFFSGRNVISLYLSNFSNFFRINRLWSFSFLLFLFSIAGIPPLAGFLGKIFILLETVKFQYFYVSSFLIVISAISTFYYIRLIKIIFFEQKKFILEIFQVILSCENVNNFLIFSISAFLLVFLFFFPIDFYFFCQYLIIDFI